VPSRSIKCRVEEPERIISEGPDRGHCSPKLLLRERLREMASSFHAVLRRVRDRATIPRRASAHHCARARNQTGAGARNQTGAIMTMHHLLTIVIAMLQEQLLWHDRHVAIHSLFAQAEKTKRG
jgi:hypothetical protein